MEVEFGPSSPSLWLCRPLGYWENQMLVDADRGRTNINFVTQLTTKQGQTINVDNFKEAVRCLIFTQPHLRACVSLDTPASWYPAKDFSDTFVFAEVEGKEGEGEQVLSTVWDRVQAEANREWDFNSGKPLYRCTLLKVGPDYVVMNCYHHSAGDGTCGSIMISSLLSFYSSLEAGVTPSLVPKVPAPSVEELTLTRSEEGEAVRQRMLEGRVERAKGFRPALSFSKAELGHTMDTSLPTNGALFSTGDRGNYRAIRRRCKEEQVTVGSLALACSYLAKAVCDARTNYPSKKYPGLQSKWIDIPVNVRNRVSNPVDKDYIGFIITEVTTNVTLDSDTTLWGLAWSIQKQLEDMFKEDQHIHFSKVKEEWETHDDFKQHSSAAAGEVTDLLVSNMMGFTGQTEFPWGKLVANHCPGSFWAPPFANYLFLFQSTEMFNYDFVYCVGEKNKAQAVELFSIIVGLMEESHLKSNTYGFKDIFNQRAKHDTWRGSN